MVQTEQKDQPVAIQTILRILRHFARRGNLEKVATKTLEIIEIGLRVMDSKQKTAVIIGKKSLTDLEKAIDFEFKVRKERKAKDNAEAVRPTIERVQRKQAKEWNKFVDEKILERGKLDIPLIPDRQGKKELSTVLKAVGYAIIRPEEARKRVTSTLDAIINRNVSDSKRTFSAWIRNYYRNISKSGYGKLMTGRFKNSAEAKKIVREAYQHFHNATGINVSSYSGVKLT